MNNKTIAVAIDDKGSQSALKWTVDDLLRKGQIVYLLHVRVKQSFSFGQKPNRISDFNEDSFMIDTDAHLRELFLPFRWHGVYQLSIMGDHPVRKVIANEHPSAHYGPMINHEVNLDNGDNDDVVGIGMSVLKFTADKANNSGFIIGQFVIKQGDVVVQKGYKDDILYKMDFMKEPPPLAKVVHCETIGLLFGNEHPELTKARARGWYVLARCTMHVCNSRDMFVDYQPATGYEVVLEDDSRVAVVGYGTVKLHLSTGKVLTLERVFHMPTIVKCCISVKTLKEMGFSLGFDAHGCYVKKGDQIVGNGFVEDGLFRLDVIDERSGGNQA
ncbi:mutator type transposase [Tanacetum coccineum]